MATKDGNYFRLILDGTTVGLSQNVDFNLNFDVQPTTNQDSGGWREYHETAGERSAEGSVDGFFDPTQTFSMEDVFDRIIAKSGHYTAQIGEVSTTGGIYYQFECAIDKGSIKASNDKPVTYSFSWKSSGAVTKHTYSGT